MNAPSAVSIAGVSHRYGPRQALADLSLEIGAGEVFVFLGPNGGGKSTLFRLLSTLIPLQTGAASILGFDLSRSRREVRSRIGVVFQAPSLDKKLTVAENVRHQAALYGLSGRAMRRRQNELLAELGVADRANERTETLSGGLRRRVELAKSMIHGPQLLLLDEPSTGLDPGARSDLWRYLRRLREQAGVTIVLTTHLLEEAEKADRIAILDRGQLVALDAPDALRATVGGDSVTIETDDAARLAADIGAKFPLAPQIVGGSVRFEHADVHSWLARVVEAFGPRIRAIRLGKPSLEDVFIAKTGHRFWQGENEDQPT